MHGLERRAMHFVRDALFCIEHGQRSSQRSRQLAAGRPDVLELQLLRPQLHQLVRFQPGVELDTVRSAVLWRDWNDGLKIHPALQQQRLVGGRKISQAQAFNTRPRDSFGVLCCCQGA